MTDVAPELRICVTGVMPALNPALDAEVERHWQSACAERTLFNGTVFSADRISPERIEGHWTEYRRLVAQMRDHGLSDALRVRSLAVCGVLCCRDGIVVGRRQADAIYEPGLWQLPPAGSVDSGAAEPGGASWRRALLAELAEELGLPEPSVRRMVPLCLVQHPSGVLDLGIRLDMALDSAEVAASHRASGNAEYDRVLTVPAAAVRERVEAEGGRLVTSAHAFLARLNRAEAGAS